MAEKFQNKYRVPSARLLGWDYRDDAMYFITICCKNRRHHFGKIENNQMILTETGKLAEKYLLEIPEHFPFVRLDAAIVMPNHLHAIVVIDRGNGNDVACNVFTDACTGSTKPNQHMATISPKPGSLSTIVRSFKSAVKKDARSINADFNWQSRFHDHIIRSPGSHHRIKKYIESNPQNWDQDKFRDL
ncbi:transposase [Flavihumibacter sp. R14]|nr:transposase [Flavihumibacter soli]